jgi:hypothetical protein
LNCQSANRSGSPLDQAFVYIQTAAEQFRRRPIDQFLATTGGYFVGNGINAGELLVIKGGEMFLSKEFKGKFRMRVINHR